VNDEIKIEGLTDTERSWFAFKAHSEGHSYEDPRYFQDMNWDERMAACGRWWTIARAFDPSIDARSGHGE